MTDVITAPDILACYTSESRAALLACSRQLQFLVQTYTTVITTDTLSNFASVCSGNWLSLALVVCQENISTSSPVFGGKLAVVALLMLCDGGTTLRPLHGQVAPAYQPSSAVYLRAAPNTPHCSEQHRTAPLDQGQASVQQAQFSRHIMAPAAAMANISHF